MLKSGILAVLVSPLILWAEIGRADGFVMGAGRWSCADVVSEWEAGDGARQGQIAGWVLGYWSAATFERETTFVDKVENAGGKKIVETTLKRCKDAGDAPLFRVVSSMIKNTK